MPDDLPALFAYNRWANDRILGAARQLTPEHYVKEPVPGWSSVRATLVHLADATDIWSRRLAGETVAARATEDQYPSLDDVARLFAQSQDAFERLLPTLTPERLAETFSYRALDGRALSPPVWAVYRHVVNHATYHRGQIVAKLKRLGVDTPATDFVLWAIEHAGG